MMRSLYRRWVLRGEVPELDITNVRVNPDAVLSPGVTLRVTYSDDAGRWYWSALNPATGQRGYDGPYRTRERAERGCEKWCERHVD